MNMIRHVDSFDIRIGDDSMDENDKAELKRRLENEIGTTGKIGHREVAPLMDDHRVVVTTDGRISPISGEMSITIYRRKGYWVDWDVQVEEVTSEEEMDMLVEMVSDQNSS